MKVSIFTKTDAGAWSDYVDSRPAATFYHRLEWKGVMEQCFGHPTFYLMAKLCRDECADAIGPAERADVSSWVEGGTLGELGFGCEGACGIVAAYSRIAR